MTQGCLQALGVRNEQIRHLPVDEVRKAVDLADIQHGRDSSARADSMRPSPCETLKAIPDDHIGPECLDLCAECILRDRRRHVHPAIEFELFNTTPWLAFDPIGHPMAWQTFGSRSEVGQLLVRESGDLRWLVTIDEEPHLVAAELELCCQFPLTPARTAYRGR